MADSGTAGGAALAAPAPGPGSGGPGPRVYFQSPPGAAGEGPGGADDEGPVRRQGKVTVKYDRKELRKRLNLEEWILEQLTRLYDCQEEEIPELEIDVDELLDMESDDARAARVKELLVDCYKPTEVRDFPGGGGVVRGAWLLSSRGLVSLMFILPPRPSSLACWTRSGACRS
ncbi:protein phosphatase 1 regulatory subunit 14B isoform X1 [Theropithecus gelada]|uniref:protein phosphatase 1 regulatory subunit 14B isoform X1 n=1 Tax=Theropithecus gelada TaxID=9565 RepID=UPI000DC177EA|nr:protein phosphatase 1 regulatory subunit 14B isoform X1 [Theropithecus gelada]